ncbi:AmmeMemoRadiSam system radical SAM enzyme [bacterium]|nr:AmmeMemoRadiSam system radical SAM enzyme [bacterium]MBU1991027.1 AmmeMemoRadiSam system radical SAM enzyme [bacterium]
MQYYRYKNENAIVCLLCKHYCTLKKDSHGICGVNFNIDSKLVNKTYSHPSAVHIDPIEKKPLYHFLPSSTSLSIGTVGCNFRCPFCQNYSISQTSNVDESIVYTPRDIVDLALKYNTKSISYTYNEPTIWYPYAKDIGILAKEYGIKNVFVSSGYESHEVLEDMKSWVDAANIDLKSFSHDYYKKVLKTDLDGVLESLIEFAKSDIWLEITTLLIPDINDGEEEIHKMAEFISTKLGVDIPWHFSAFHPDYKMLDTPSTSLQSMERAKKIAKSHGIKYVYLGNIQNDSSTYCSNCGMKLIDRNGFSSGMPNMEDGKCMACGSTIKGVWS